MYHILPESEGNLIAIRVEGIMRAEDYKTLLPFIETAIREQGTIRILSDLRNLKSVEFRGIFNTLPYAFKYRSKVEKKAVITDMRWIYILTKLSSPFFTTQVRCFPSSEVNKAWAWIKK